MLVKLPVSCFYLATLVVVSDAGVDVEDLIERGYTCALADRNAENDVPEPGTEIVCDDGVCSQCVKTQDRARSSIMRRKDMDVEDYLKYGYVCSAEERNAPDAETVCDDGFCFGCKKPVRRGGRGDVEDYLENGFNCFLVNDVPKYALVDDVEVVCDDGDCFGCIHVEEKHSKKPSKNLDDLLALGYTCTITRKTIEDGDDIVCENGKCFSCTNPSASNKEYPVSRRFLDQAEDYLDDGYNCGLALQQVSKESPRDKILCEGDICLICWEGSTTGDQVANMISESVVEKAEHLAKQGYNCKVYQQS